MPPPLAEQQGEETLLDDLLEASARILHRNISTTQQTFFCQYQKVFDEELAKEPAETDPSLAEKRVAARLLTYKLALKEREWELIEDQRQEFAQRNKQILAFCEQRNQ